MKLVAWLAAMLALLAVPSVRSAVIGIDFGTDLIKVALVKPGTPFHIVTDEQSKRKSPAVVAFDGDERFFGNNAVSLSVKKPKHTYTLMHRLLNKAINSPQVAQLKSLGYPFDFVTLPSTGGVGVQHSKNVTFSPEELLAMTFQNLISISETDAEQPVKDCVITVPEYFSQNERQALIDAAEMAGLNVLSLVNENTAFAIQYGLDIKYEPDTNKRVLFYNMGSSTTIVSVVEFTSYTKVISKKENKTIGQLEVRSVAWDEGLGGSAFDLLIAEWIRDKFQTALTKRGDPSVVSANPRAMAKIRKAAGDAKKTLSANKDVPINIVSLLNDIDFRDKITRDELNQLAAPLLARVRNPVDKALTDAGLEAKDLDSLVLLGGSTRIPAVLERLRELAAPTLKGDVATNIDADEAGAMGAVIRAANLSTAFQVRKFGLVDITPFPVGVQLSELADAKTLTHVSTESVEDAEAEIAAVAPNADDILSKRAQLFKRNSRLVKRKTVAFSHTRDFSCSLFHESPELLLSPFSAPIAEYNITGLTALMSDTKYAAALANGQKPKVSTSFVLDSSGLVDLVRAEATIEEIVKVPVKKPNATATATANSSTEAENATATATEDAEESGVETPTEDEEAASTPAAEAAPATTDDQEFTTKTKIHRIKLKITRASPEGPGFVKNIDQAAKLAGKAMLAEYTRKDKARAALFAARNNLESSVYDLKNKMEESDVIAVSTEAQREAAIAACNSAASWLEEQGDSTEIQAYVDKLAEVRALSDPILSRAAEMTLRPEAVARTRTAVTQTKEYIQSWVNKTWLSNTSEYKQLVNLTEQFEKWLDEKEAEQAAKAAHEPAVFESTHLKTRMNPIAKLVSQLMKRKPPVAPVKQPKFNFTKFNSTKDKNATEGAETEGAETEGDKDDIDTATGDAEAESGSSDTTAEQSESSEQTTKDGEL